MDLLTFQKAGLVGGDEWRDFHFRNQTVLEAEKVAGVFVGQHCSAQIAHDLMHIDQNAAVIFRIEVHWLDIRVDFGPLRCPVGADFFRATDKAALKCFRPSHVRSHGSESSVNIAGIEGFVGRAQ